MNYLYILQGVENSKFYIGSTNNLERRLKEHLAGKVRTTRVLKITKLVYSEEFETIQEARLRERKLKSYKSHKYLEKLIARNR